MSSSRVRFTGSDGDELAAILDMPDKGRPAAYALFAHCFTCSKDYKSVVNISRALVQRDIGVMRFDFTGLGESEGDFSETTFSSNVEDLIAAAEYMKSRHESPAILIGHSFGGAAVIQAAGKIQSSRAVAVIATPYDPSHVADLLQLKKRFENKETIEVNISGRTFRLKRKFLDDLRNEAIKRPLADLRKPLIIFHSPADAVVGIDNAAKIFQAAKHPKSFVSLDGADHLLSDPADSQYVGFIIAEWARRYIA
jgi:alpha/beta superfamily hydrolase